MGRNNFFKTPLDQLKNAPKKNKFLPAELSDDLVVSQGKNYTKDFTVSTDFIQGAAEKVIRKHLNFLPTQLIDYADDIPIGISALGLPIFDNLTFLAGQYSQINNQGTQQVVPFDGIQIDTVLVEGSQQKNIVKTQIAGREGTVKEYISSDDTTITITGAIVNTFSGAYPRREVLTLLRILQVPQQVQVISKFINDYLGFEYITIESWNFPTTAGLRNTQAFTITAVNDISPETDEVTGDQIVDPATLLSQITSIL